MSNAERLLKGVGAIAGELGRHGLRDSERTIRRLHSEGKLGRKLHGRTSPIIASAEEVERFLKRGES